MNNVVFAKEKICTFSRSSIAYLKSLALQSTLKRSRFCLHLCHDDMVQEMVIVLHKETFIPPHRHKDKTESFHMIEGEVLISFFDDLGNIERFVHLGKKNDLIIYRMSNDKWHSVIPITEYAVFHEVSKGPFEKPEFPTWEPKENEIQLFLNKILDEYKKQCKV